MKKKIKDSGAGKAKAKKRAAPREREHATPRRRRTPAAKPAARAATPATPGDGTYIEDHGQLAPTSPVEHAENAQTIEDPMAPAPELQPDPVPEE